jgi:sulfatase modifying factor 1
MFSISLNSCCRALGHATALALLSAGCAQSAAPVAGPKSSPVNNLSLLSKAVAPTLASVKPPGNPKINHHFVTEKKLAEMPVPQQPPELKKSLAELQSGSLEERMARLKAKVFTDMVYVHGGSFMRGDFTKLLGIEGVTRMTYNEDDKVVREITLSDFWISKYKTTYAEFDVFTDATGRPRTGTEFGGKYRHPTVPARAYWQEAKDYCQWLGQITGLPIDLPTEAEWEYAARSRGQFFMIPTDDGTIEFGRNVPYAAQEEVISPVRNMDRYPVGLFPPNPLGMYDMSDNGLEWINDWYAANAYQSASADNPSGPDRGVLKVVRSWSSDTLKIGVATWRRSREPIPLYENADSKIVPVPTSSGPSLRCAVRPR